MRSKNYANDINILRDQLADDFNKKYPQAGIDDAEYLQITLVACATALAKTFEQAVDRVVEAILPERR